MIIPAYNSGHLAVPVVKSIPEWVWKIYLVDDACPIKTGELVSESVKDKRLTVISNTRNLGVGGAVKVGLEKALSEGAEVCVKLDSDGQMEPRLIEPMVAPILSGASDYVKGNRFFTLESVQSMPKSRVFGNAALSLMSKFSTGYWSINDPTNGFFAIDARVLAQINLQKLRKGWFFESDLLFRLSILRAKVTDMPMRARYGKEKSNLRPIRVVWEFAYRHTVNSLKRIFYNYYLREWSAVSVEVPLAILLIGSGLLAVAADSQSALPTEGLSPLILSLAGIFVGFQLLLSSLTQDIASEPREPIAGKLGEV